MDAQIPGDERMSDSGARSSLGSPGPEASRAPPAGLVRRHENHLLASLPQADLAVLARQLHVVSVPAGAVLQHQDHPLDYVYFPHDGLISLLAITPDGATVEAASIGRRGAVCPLHRSDLRQAFLTAVAQSPMRVSRM